MWDTLADLHVDFVDRVIQHKRRDYPLPATATVRVDGKWKFMDVAGDGWSFTAKFRLASVEEVEQFAQRISQAGSF